MDKSEFEQMMSSEPSRLPAPPESMSLWEACGRMLLAAATLSLVIIMVGLAVYFVVGLFT